MRKPREYALYRGDEFIDLGTAKYLAEKYHKSEQFIRWLAYPSSQKRMDKPNKNWLTAIKIEEDEE